MTELAKSIKDKYKDFDITSQHLGKVICDNNKTRKRTRHKHFPKTRYKQPINQKAELDKFYSEINKYSLNEIISIKPSMIQEYSRCELGQRCVVNIFDSIRQHWFTCYLRKNKVSRINF